MAIGDIVVTDIVATMVILITGGITGGGTTVPSTTGLITEAFMATRMVAIAAGIEDSGIASVTKTEKERMPKRLGAEAPATRRPYS
jgi:hypothetical protein